MPLPSVLNGALQCTKLCKRTGIRCKNPCAYGSKVACKTHGSHKSRNVIRGVDHPRYRHGMRTREVETILREKSVTLRYLVDLGNYVQLFYKVLKHKGRPPNGYVKANLADPKQLAITLLKVLISNKS